MHSFGGGSCLESGNLEDQEDVRLTLRWILHK